MDALAEALKDSGRLLVGMSDAIAYAAKKAAAQPRHGRGFQVLKDWDGSGRITDRRWRGGRRRRKKMAREGCRARESPCKAICGRMQA
jgi:YD repeat-containing protein